MKKIIFLMAMFVGLTAMAQNEVVTEKWSMEQEIPVKLKEITVINNAHVKIIQSDKNSVRVESGNSDVVCDLTKDIVTLSGTSMSIGKYNNVEVRVADLSSLEITSRGNAHIDIVTEKECDTINIPKMVIVATDNSTIMVKAPISNTSLGIASFHNATIRVLDNVKSDCLMYVNNDNANLYIKDFIDAKGSPVKGSNVSGTKAGFHVGDNSFTLNSKENIVNGKSEDLSLYGKNRKGQFYTAANRLNAGFYFGWNNWGDAPFNGLVSLPGAYDVKTSCSALTFEISYSLICHPHFAAGIGVGIGRNKMKFTNGYVDYGENGLIVLTEDELAPYNDLNNWKSSYFMRQVSLPIHFNYYASTEHWKGFNTSITIIPLLHFMSGKSGITNIYEGEIGIENKEKHSDNPIDSFGCDVRISLGYSWLNVYLQTSLLPLFEKSKMDNMNIYPVSIGLGIAF